MSGALSFGEKISEAHYAAMFDVSRTPVREAILMLVSLGLLEVRPRSGTYVISFTQRSLRELFDVRFTLETAGIELALPSQRQKVLTDLKQQFSEMDGYAKSRQSLDAFHSVDTDFHRRLVSACENDRLTEMYRPVEICVQAARSRLSQDNSVSITANEHHAKMIAALENDDISRFKRHLRDHLTWVLGMLMRVDELFTPAPL